MIKFYIFLLIFFSMFGQFLIGNFGIFLPVTATVIFYITVCFGWQRGMFSAVVSGLAFDAVIGASNLTPLIFLAVCGLAVFWLLYQQIRPAFINFIPGMLIALIAVLPQMLQRIYDKGWGIYIFDEWLPAMFFAMGFCALLLPLVIVVCDHFGRTLGVPAYIDAKNQLTQGK